MPQRTLLIGRSGSRKTTLASSWPKPLLSLDWDRRNESLMGREGIEVKQLKGRAHWNESEEIFEKLLKNNPFKTIMLSSYTSLSKIFLQIGVHHYETTTNPDKGFRVQITPQKSILLTDMPHYKVVHQMWDRMIDFLFELDCNIVMEAHIERMFNSENQIVGKKMLGSPTLAERIPGYFTETYECYTKEILGKPPAYHVRTRGEVFKTSYEDLPDEIEVTNKERNFYDEWIKPRITTS